jgi:catechol 2,3-dioxygenase-like lactoylglutathione lyase family enzyme
MALQATAIMLGVENLERSKAFYTSLGATIEQDHPGFVRLALGEGSPSLALYERAAAAADAGVSPEGSGFTGVSFHFIVPSGEDVDRAMKEAVAADAEVVRDVAQTDWGTFGYFGDPDGYLWKVASSGR